MKPTSPLRRQLETATQEYRNIRYPGDLAREAFPPRRWRRVIGLSGYATGAIAAAVLAILLARPHLLPAGRPGNSRTASFARLSSQVESSLAAFPSASSLRAHLGLRTGFSLPGNLHLPFLERIEKNPPMVRRQAA